MKAVAYEIIDGFSIVRSICEPTIDPELTRAEARRRLEKSGEWKTFNRAYRVCAGLDDAKPEEIAAAKVQLLKVLDDVLALREAIAEDSDVYFSIPGEANILDAHADELRRALSNLKGHELLTLDGKIVADERGRRAWKLEDSGRWDYMTISKLGERLPDGYQWSEDLRPAELNAIREQMDRERIEAMSADERMARANGEIDAALDAIVRRHLRAQIKGEASSSEALREQYLDASARIYERYSISSEGDDGRPENPTDVRREARSERAENDGDGS